MAFVDKEVCKLSKCPFLDKKTGFCGRALTLRKKKEEVCVSNINITLEAKK
jgi:hypothetical protein